VQRGAAGYDDLGKLLALRLEWRLLVNRMFNIRDIEQCCAESLFIVLEIFRRILDEQPVTGLQLD
jgi:hypothetical protein